MDIISDIWLGWIVAIFFLFTWCSDEREKKAMLEEISSHQNVVAINTVHNEDDEENVIGIDISLKNDVRMEINGCKRKKNNDIVYEDVSIVNGWFLWEITRKIDSDRYRSGSAYNEAGNFLGNNSLLYLLDNYQKFHDFYMSAPELDPVSALESYTGPSERLREIFDNTSDECMQDIYENGKVIVVRKLYRVKSTNDELYNLGNSSDSEGRIFNEPVGSSIFRVKRKNELILIKFKTKSFRQDTPQELEQMQFHIANIPEVLKGLDFVFRAPLGRGEDYDTNANGDKISLFSDTERSLSEVNIATYINENEIDKILEFNLEQFDFPADGAERAYTPAMLWLTRRMNGIYDDWQKEQQEAGR